jgi:hypothetical protein
MSGHINVGLNCDLYYNSGTYSTPVWNVIPIVQDVELPLETDVATMKKRGSTFEMHVPTFSKAPLNFKIYHDTSDITFTFLQSAWVGRTVLDMAQADGPIANAGTQYWRADYYCTGFKDAQPLEDFEAVDVECKLAVSTNPQGFTTVGS